jgi:hypothetical protein
MFVVRTLVREHLNECKNTPVLANGIRAPVAHGGNPRRSLLRLRQRRLANAALCAKASPLLPKGEASAKGEDRTGLTIQTKATDPGFQIL